MSESMRLANEYKADRVDQFYAALHESAFGTSGHGAMSESCPLLEVKRISLPGCIERLRFEGTLGPLPLAPRTLGLPSGPNEPYSLA